MKTLISHFYNEEYLLPWWLNHHKKYFDHGIMINYQSSDNSVNLIKEICPTWEIIDTKNDSFGAAEVDKEVMDIEKSLSGWRIVLNTTEFLIGDFSLLDDSNENKDFFIPPLIMVDCKETEFVEPNPKISLISQRKNGASYHNWNHFSFKKSRKLSNYFSQYPMGRHFGKYNTENFLILWYGFSPMTEGLIQRKLQIQNKIPESNKIMGLGHHHLVDRGSVLHQFKSWQDESKNLSEYIDKYNF